LRLFILHGYVAGVRGIRARAVAILSLASLSTIVLAVVGFHEEAALRHEPMPFFEMLYSAFGLFAFAGNRFGFPKTDLLVSAYFIAPFLTASALFEAAMRIAEARKPLLLVGLRGHTLVCGAGKLGMLLARHWDARRVPTALVDVSAPELAREAPYLVVLGDMTREATLRAARAPNAGRIFLTAGDDLINLEVATRLQTMLPPGGGPAVFCHIADATLRHSLRKGHSTKTVTFFNSYGLAARALVGRLFAEGWLPALSVDDDLLLERGGTDDAPNFTLRSRGAPREPSANDLELVVVVGLGRFGRAVAEQFHDVLPDETRLALVDRDAGTLEWARGRLSSPPNRVETFASDISDPAWLPRIRALGPRALVVLCTDQDRQNLRMALQLADFGIRTIVRMFDEDFGDRLAGLRQGQSQLDVAGFQSLFLAALPLLTCQGDYDGRRRESAPEDRARRWVKTCVHAPRNMDCRRWFLTWLPPTEAAFVAASAATDARSLSAIAVVGQAARGESDTGWWLLTDTALDRLAEWSKTGGAGLGRVG
jgi:Trk K+ transport system NAD-binding subunit